MQVRLTKMNKLLQTIKESDEKFDRLETFFCKAKTRDDWTFTKDSFDVKSHITQSRIKELEALVTIVNQIQEVEPESNGRFNACNEMREVLQDTIKQLKTN